MEWGTVANGIYSGVHSRDHLSDIIDEHYKQEDLDFYVTSNMD